MLESLGFTLASIPPKLVVNLEPIYVDLHLIAVVKKLPDQSDFLCSYELMRAFRGADPDISLGLDQTSELEFYLPASVTDVDQLVEDIMAFDAAEESYYMTLKSREYQLEDIEGQPTHPRSIKFKLDRPYYPREVSDFMRGFGEFLNEGTYPIKYEWALKQAGGLESDPKKAPGNYVEGNSKYHFFCLHFSELDSIAEFREYLLTTSNYNISLDRIEALSNFNVVSLLTRLLALGLMFFTLVGLVLFISNLLSSHLDNIKMNLGTFLAFGMSHKFLIRSYLKIISYMTLKIIFIALLLAWVSDWLQFPRLIDFLMGDSRGGMHQMFSVWNTWTFFCLGLLLVTAIFVTYRIVKKHIARSPGDLIYNREL
jgi:hypothetical protein